MAGFRDKNVVRDPLKASFSEFDFSDLTGRMNRKGVQIHMNTEEHKSFHYHRSVSPFY